MNAYLMRYEFTQDYIRGVLFVGGIMLHTLERPWQNNRRNVSCIPDGQYKVDFLPRTYSGKFNNVYHLQSVPNRTGILIHVGNLVEQIQGCILVGLKPGVLAGKPAVLQSGLAMNKLRKEIGRKSFNLNVSEYHLTVNQPEGM